MIAAESAVSTVMGWVFLAAIGFWVWAAHKRRQARIVHRPISEAGARTATGELACPRCGSTQFVAKRSAGGKVMAGVLAAKTRVRCVACGTTFIRG